MNESWNCYILYSNNIIFCTIFYIKTHYETYYFWFYLLLLSQKRKQNFRVSLKSISFIFVVSVIFSLHIIIIIIIITVMLFPFDKRRDWCYYDVTNAVFLSLVKSQNDDWRHSPGWRHESTWLHILTRITDILLSLFCFILFRP
jgi:hypothetical protein